MSTAVCGGISSSEPPKPTSPWDGIPPERQYVVVLCGGRECTRVPRMRLGSLRAGSYPQSMFGLNSRFLGSVVCWSGGAWRWEVPGSTPEDADDVRRVLTLAGADQSVLERLVGASTPRTKHFAREWGLM